MKRGVEVNQKGTVRLSAGQSSMTATVLRVSASRSVLTWKTNIGISRMTCNSDDQGWTICAVGVHRDPKDVAADIEISFELTTYRDARDVPAVAPEG